METHINSLHEFISQITDTSIKSPDGYTRFYRGQASDWAPNPSVFRSDNLTEHENVMFHEIVNKKPEEFANCKCTFDHLVKMQHYHIPTRLLDITSNPLIALYFACSCTDTDKPTVYYLDVPNELIKNYSSDSVTILSALARYDSDSKADLLRQLEVINLIKDAYTEQILTLVSNTELQFGNEAEKINIHRNANKITDTVKNKLNRYDVDFYMDDKAYIYDATCRAISHAYASSPQRRNEENIKSIVSRHYNKIIDERLLHEIKQDKPYFQDLMKAETFETIYCVNPKLDNPRIIKQNGSFLLFPSEVITLEDSEIKCRTISVNKNKVNEILEHLQMMDISNESLLTDMDSVSAAISKKYQ